MDDKKMDELYLKNGLEVPPIWHRNDFEYMLQFKIRDNLEDTLVALKRNIEPAERITILTKLNIKNANDKQVYEFLILSQELKETMEKVEDIYIRLDDIRGEIYNELNAERNQENE